MTAASAPARPPEPEPSTPDALPELTAAHAKFGGTTGIDPAIIRRAAIPFASTAAAPTVTAPIAPVRPPEPEPSTPDALPELTAAHAKLGGTAGIDPAIIRRAAIPFANARALRARPLRRRSSRSPPIRSHAAQPSRPRSPGGRREGRPPRTARAHPRAVVGAGGALGGGHPEGAGARQGRAPLHVRRGLREAARSGARRRHGPRVCPARRLGGAGRREGDAGGAGPPARVDAPVAAHLAQEDRREPRAGGKQVREAIEAAGEA